MTLRHAAIVVILALLAASVALNRLRRPGYGPCFIAAWAVVTVAQFLPA